MTFEELLYRAKQGDKSAIEQIIELYRPLLIKHSLICGKFDEDLYHDLVVELLKCIQYYRELE